MTALFAPMPVRETLFTLYAFNHELARAREVASEPLLALMRLQWWREVVEGARKPHEVATPLRAAIEAGVLDPAILDEMIQARMQEADEEIDEPGWTAYLRGSGGALMRQAGIALGAGSEGEALTRLGAACGAVGVLRNGPAWQAQRRWIFPQRRDESWAAGEAARMLDRPRRWPGEAIAAVLPAVMARRHLQRWPKAGPDGWARLAIWMAALRDLA